MNIPLELSNKYDEFGKLKIEPWQNIKKGDKISFLTNIIYNKKTIKVKHIGFWDGEKVQFNDKDKTIVRTIRWLSKESNI